MEFTTIKGFKDILPWEAVTWERLNREARRHFHSYGFQEIMPPLLEMTELFSRSIGEDTDIVSKEMYTLGDSKGRSLTLRPEATASLVRAYIEHRLYEKNPIQKLFTIGPMFRHERPQKGRFRQFHQIDAEIFGDPGPKSDAEIVLLGMALFESLGLSGLSLQINSLGYPDCRQSFRDELKRHLSQKSALLCSDCQRRTETNPLRVFDCKVEGCREVVSNAPSILDYICEDCRSHFDSVQEYLRLSGISFTVNHKLVRGLDYYTRTTFEIQTDRLGAQNAVLGGGRYDGLSKQLGGPDHPAIGFAIGIERLVALLDEQGRPEMPVPDLLLAAIGPEAERKGFHWAMEMRKAGLWVEIDYAPKGLKAQLRRADRVKAKKVLIVGESELASGKGILRDMSTKAQTELPLDNLVAALRNCSKVI